MKNKYKKKAIIDLHCWETEIAKDLNNWKMNWLFKKNIPRKKFRLGKESRRIKRNAFDLPWGTHFGMGWFQPSAVQVSILWPFNLRPGSHEYTVCKVPSLRTRSLTLPHWGACTKGQSPRTPESTNEAHV